MELENLNNNNNMVNSDSFGPKQQHFSLPKRSKNEKKIFDWFSQTGTTILLNKTSNIDDRFVFLLTGKPIETQTPAPIGSIANVQQAQSFVEYVEKNLKNFIVSLKEEETRSAGELRGPIKWSETLSWRSTSFGAENFYVSKTQTRTYDCPENRILVSALARIVESVPKKWRSPQSSDPAVVTALRAEKLLRSKPLDQVKVLHYSKLNFAAKRTRNGRHSKLYQPALNIFDLHTQKSPSSMIVGHDDIHYVCDNNSKAFHLLVVELDRRLQTLEVHSKDLTIKVESDHLKLGEITFCGGENGYVMWNEIEFCVNAIGSAHSPPSRKKQKVITVNTPEEIYAFVDSTVIR